MHSRLPLLEEAVELYEIRALLGASRGSGEQHTAARFESIVAPANGYRLPLQGDAVGGSLHLVCLTQDNGVTVEYDRAPRATTGSERRSIS